MKIITIDNLYKIYRSGSGSSRVETVALRGINLEIHDNDFLAIMGPSGSGKTTLLNILGGLDKSSAGDVIYHVKGDNNLSDMDERQLDRFRHDKIAVIFQADNLLSHLTALENVELPLQFLGREDHRDRATYILGKLGLGDRLHHMPSQLSGGERQRVALATALAYNPMIILADEPTGELDQDNVRMVMELFQQIHQSEGITFLIVTHNASVARYASRYFSLFDGQLTEQSDLSGFSTVHSGTGDYIVTVDEMNRLTIPAALLSEIQVQDGLISYDIGDDRIIIRTLEKKMPVAQIDQRNRVLLPTSFDEQSYRANLVNGEIVIHTGGGE